MHKKSSLLQHMARTSPALHPKAAQNLVIMYPWAPHVSDSAQKKPFSSCFLDVLWWKFSTALYQFKWKTEIQKCNFLCSFWPWKEPGEFLKETLSAKQSLRCGLSSLKWLSGSLLDLWPWTRRITSSIFTCLATYVGARLGVLLQWHREWVGGQESGEGKQVFSFIKNLASPIPS